MATGGATWGIVSRGNLKGRRVAVRNGVVLGGHKARPGDVSIGGPPTRGEAIIQTTRGAQQAAGRANVPFGDLPKNLTALTPAQERRVVRELATLSLRELRRRQDLVARQARSAYARGNTAGLADADAMTRHLSAAVDRREFGGR